MLLDDADGGNTCVLEFARPNCGRATDVAEVFQLTLGRDPGSPSENGNKTQIACVSEVIGHP